MKTFAFSCFLALSFSLSAIEVPPAFKQGIYQNKETKKEINAKKLPKEVTFDITKNYNGAKILKAYERYRGEEMIGYIVEIEKVDKKWTLTYDDKGNPENKVTP